MCTVYTVCTWCAVGQSLPSGVVLARAAGWWPRLPPAQAVVGGGWAAGRQFGQMAGPRATEQMVAWQLAGSATWQDAWPATGVRLGGQAVRRQGRPEGLRLRWGPGRARRPVSVTAAQ